MKVKEVMSVNPSCCTKYDAQQNRKCLKNMVSAAGFEPATHALKGQSEGTLLDIFQ